METVSFTAMAQGTKADYDLLARYEHEYMAAYPDRLLAALDKLERCIRRVPGQPLRALAAVGHAEPTATAATRSTSWRRYCTTSVTILRPTPTGRWWRQCSSRTCAPRCAGPSSTTGCSRCTTTARHTGDDPNGRDRYRDQRILRLCAEFCELYDQNCFDPGYESLGVEVFEPMVRRVFAEPRYL